MLKLTFPDQYVIGRASQLCKLHGMCYDVVQGSRVGGEESIVLHANRQIWNIYTMLNAGAPQRASSVASLSHNLASIHH